MININSIKNKYNEYLQRKKEEYDVNKHNYEQYKFLEDRKKFYKDIIKKKNDFIREFNNRNMSYSKKKEKGNQLNDYDIKSMNEYTKEYNDILIYSINLEKRIKKIPKEMFKKIENEYEDEKKKKEEEKKLEKLEKEEERIFRDTSIPGGSTIKSKKHRKKTYRNKSKKTVSKKKR
jgi:hypothetical protein